MVVYVLENCFFIRVFGFIVGFWGYYIFSKNRFLKLVGLLSSGFRFEIYWELIRGGF